MRSITNRSLHADIIKGRYFIEDDLRSPMAALIKRLSTVKVKRGIKWKKTPVLDTMKSCIELVEALLFDSGELTDTETTQRQRIYTCVYEVKRQVEDIINHTRGKVSDILNE